MLRISFLSEALLIAVIRAPGLDPLKIPLGAKRATVDDVSVWEWSGSAYDEGDEAAEWFSSYFGKPTRLVRFNEGIHFKKFQETMLKVTKFYFDLKRICFAYEIYISL